MLVLLAWLLVPADCCAELNRPNTSSSNACAGLGGAAGTTMGPGLLLPLLTGSAAASRPKGSSSAGAVAATELSELLLKGLAATGLGGGRRVGLISACCPGEASSPKGSPPP